MLSFLRQNTFFYIPFIIYYFFQKYLNFLLETLRIEMPQKSINSISTQWTHCGVALSAIPSKFKLLPAFALSRSLVSQQRITTEDIGSAYVSADWK